MKTIKSITGFFLLVLLFSACSMYDNDVTPSSRVTTRSMEVGSFTALDVSDAFRVYVTLTDQEAPVTVEANDNLHRYIRIHNSGGRLIVEFSENIDIKQGDPVLNVYVSTPTLNDIEASGASYVALDTPLYTDFLDVDLSGASLLRGTLHTGEVQADLSGASALQILGSTVDFRIDASGSSSMEGYGFLTKYLDANLDGASQASLSVEDEIRIEASGASILRYRGEATIVHQELSGAASVVKVD